MKKIIAFIFIAMLIVIVTLSIGCARINTIDITKTGATSTTYSGVTYELEFLPDGTRKIKFSNKKDKPLWERIADKVKPNELNIGK